MSSDSSSSTAPGFVKLSDDIQHAVWSFVVQQADTAPVGTKESIIFAAAVQHILDEYKADITIDQVQQAVSLAREKRRKRSSADKRVKKKRDKQEEKQKEWEQELEGRRTRGQRRLYIDTAPRPPSPLSLLNRAPSEVTHAALQVTQAIDRLRARNKVEKEEKKVKKVKASTSKTTPHRVALTDITNQLSSPMAEPPSAVSSSSSSSSTATVPDIPLTIPSTVQGSIQSPFPSPPPSTSSLSSPPPIPFTSPHAAGLLSAGARISGKQQKKEMKRRVAEETHLLVQTEMQRRQKQDEVIEMTGQSMRDIARVTAKLECWLDRVLAGRE